MKNSVKQRLAHEVKEFLVVFLFIAPFVFALASYRLYLRPSESPLFAYGTAVVNAFAVAKIILTLDLARVGKSSEKKPLIVPTLHKSAVATLLYLAFRGVETMVRGLLQGQNFLAALDAAFIRERGEFVLLGLVTFLAALPFFALREMRRVLGLERFQVLFFGAGRTQHLSESAGSAVEN
jgi:hypothetical protein